MNITFILKDGSRKTVEFKEGQTMLQVAEENGIQLNSNCEGFGVCGGCHIKVENFLDKMPEITDNENDTLDRVPRVSMNSRLACRVFLTAELDGLVVRLM